MAIYTDYVQGSPEWMIARLGIPTASEFSKIITPKQEPTKDDLIRTIVSKGLVYKKSMKKDDLLKILKDANVEDDYDVSLSAQHDEYANLKIAEIMTGESQGLLMPTYHMERGQLMEAEARESYEFTHDVKTENGGFWTDDLRRFGASPDFLVGNDGIGEIKCLDGKQHVKYLIENRVKDDFTPQIQGQLYICEKEWCDWWMYHPNLPRVAIRTYRDEKYIKKLEEALIIFREKMSAKIEILQDRGLWFVATESIHQVDVKQVDDSEHTPSMTHLDDESEKLNKLYETLGGTVKKKRHRRTKAEMMAARGEL